MKNEYLYTKIRANFFWVRNPLKNYINYLNAQPAKKNIMKPHYGYIIKQLNPQELLTEEEINKMSEYFKKSPKMLQRALRANIDQVRYIAVFGESIYLHVFPHCYIGDFFEISN